MRIFEYKLRKFLSLPSNFTSKEVKDNINENMVFAVFEKIRDNIRWNLEEKILDDIETYE